MTVDEVHDVGGGAPVPVVQADTVLEDYVRRLIPGQNIIIKIF